MRLRVDHGLPEIVVRPELMVLDFILQVDFLEGCVAMNSKGKGHELSNERCVLL